jgi:hypothetical protein
VSRFIHVLWIANLVLVIKVDDVLWIANLVLVIKVSELT